MINQNFVIVGAIIAAVGSLSYLIDTLKGRVKPNRVSFLLWSLAPLIAFFAEVKQGVGIQALMIFIVGFLPLTIFIASFVNKKAVAFPLYIVLITLVIFSLVQFKLGKQIRLMLGISA